MGKHHRDHPANVRLNLPQTPIGAIGVAHQHAGRQDRVHPSHRRAPNAKMKEAMRDLTDPSLDLIALLGSRICHDLISPLGAIGNGIELLAMSGLKQTPEMALISESVENANARIRFFRVAFGAAGPTQEIRRSELLSILGPLSSLRVRIDWQVSDSALRSEAKLAFLLIQCMESALPWGGTITVSKIGNRWQLKGTADRIKDLPHLWPLISQGTHTEEIAPSEVQFPLAHRAATEMGVRVDCDITGGAITLSF